MPLPSNRGIPTSSARRASGKGTTARPLGLERLEDRLVLSMSPAYLLPLGSSPTAAATADFDGDGRLDLAVAVNSATPSVKVMLGLPTGNFQAAQTSTADTVPVRSIAAGDLDQDGTVDLVTTSLGGFNFENGNLSLLFGNGDGTFQPPVTNAFYGPLSVAMGDLDGDTDLDVVVTLRVYTGTEPTFKVRQYDNYVAVIRNDLDTVNHFANLNLAYFQYLYSGYRTPDAIKIVDINGHPNVTFVSPETNTVYVMPGNGTINLAGLKIFATGTTPRSVAVGDVNGDGIEDLVTANSGSNNLSVLLGNGPGSNPLFQTAVAYAAGTSPIAVGLADFNADTRLDIVAANAGSDNVSMLLGNGNGTFQTALSYAAGSGPIAMAIGNFNGDHNSGGRPYPDLAVADSTGNAVRVLLNAANWPASPAVVGRHLFYNHSAFDGGSAEIDASDDAARATDKTAYLPNGTTAVFENISSYTVGINGIMVDLSAGGNHSAITAADFVFKVGNNNLPGSWTTAPTPSSVSVRSGAGAGGADRVEITWADHAIKNTWLEVQVLANSRTGLPSPDVFFWGSRVGDTGNPSATDFSTTVSGDAGDILTQLGAGGGIANVWDINRSNSVTVSGDRGDVLTNLGTLTRIKIGNAGPFAPEGGGGSSAAGVAGDAGIATALVAASGSSSSINSSPLSEILVPSTPDAPELPVERIATVAAIDAVLTRADASEPDGTGRSDLDDLLELLASGV